MAAIDVLMATYNGGEYLREQIDSILAQTFEDWRLLIRDDGSNDDISLSILKEYEAAHPGKIVVLDDGRGNLGPLGNFAALLESADADYFNFSDQDDIWKLNKLELAYQRMKEMEAQYGTEQPLLVFADREIVDANKKLLAASYWQVQGQHPKNFSDLLSLMPKCIAAGSTMLLNRVLREKCLPIPETARMHDTWIELVAAGLGKMSYIDEVALSYRRHGNNVSGGTESFKESRSIFARAGKLFKQMDVQKNVYRINFTQAETFYKRYNSEMDMETRERVEKFLAFRYSNIFVRVFLLLAHKLGPYGWERKLSFIWLAGGAK